MSFIAPDPTKTGRHTPCNHRSPKSPLRLGDIASNLKDPVVNFTVLNEEARVPIPEANIHTTIQEDFYPKLRNPQEAKLVHSARIRGLEIQNIDGIPKSDLKILETQLLSLPKGYLDNCMNLESVKVWRENNADCLLHLITGLKTIREPPHLVSVAGSTIMEEEAMSKIGSVPDQAKIGDQGQCAAEHDLEHVTSSDYLLAYQMSRVKQTRRKNTMVDGDGNFPQRQARSVDRQRICDEDSPSFIISPPMWVIFRRA